MDEEEVPIKLSKVASCKVVYARENVRSPIIIEKSSHKRSSKVNVTETVMAVPKASMFSPRQAKPAKSKVEQFEPIDIPQRKAKNFDNIVLEKNKSQEIEIRIEETGK